MTHSTPYVQLDMWTNEQIILNIITEIGYVKSLAISIFDYSDVLLDTVHYL